MSNLRGTELREIQRALDELRLEISSVRLKTEISRLPGVPPKSPKPGDIWWSGGEIKVYHPNGIETYSKD